MPQMNTTGHVWQYPLEKTWFPDSPDNERETMCSKSPGKQDILDEIRSYMDKHRETKKQKDEIGPSMINEQARIPEIAMEFSKETNEMKDSTDQDVSAFVNVETEPPQTEEKVKEFVEKRVSIEQMNKVNTCEEPDHMTNSKTVDPGTAPDVVDTHPSLSLFQRTASDMLTNLPTYVYVYIHGKPVRALVDSGASITIMNSEVMKHIPELQNNSVTPGNYQNIRSADGSLIPLAGKLDINLNFDGENVDFGVTLCESLYVPLILGADFFLKHEVILDYQNGLFRIGSSQLTMHSNDIQSRVSLNNNVILPPLSATTIVVKLDTEITSSEIFGDTIVIEPDRGILHNKMVSFANAICQVDQHSCAMIEVINMERYPVRLHENTYIGMGCPLVNYMGLDAPHTNQPDEFVHGKYAYDDNPLLTDHSWPILESQKDYDDSMPNVNLEATCLSDDQLEDFKQFLKMNRHVFANRPEELTQSTLPGHVIDTMDAIPVRQQPYKTNPKMKGEIEKLVNQLLDQGVIERAQSPWNSPILLICKKDKQYRFVTDLRAVNRLTKKYSHTLPNPTEILETIGSVKPMIMSSLDLLSGFFQIEIEPSSREKTAFTVPGLGQFQYQRLPMGLTNSPARFQEAMNLTLRGLNWRHVCCYMDDIIVFSLSYKEHKQHLQEVFDRLTAVNMKLKSDKCHLAKDQLVYLGVTINSEGTKPNMKKVEVIQNFSVPKTVKEVRRFLGMVQFYRNWIKSCGEISKPIRDLLKKEARFKWTKECQKAFEILKTALTTAPVLRHADPNKAFYLQCDACEYSVGAILSQKDDQNKEYVVAYAGRALTDTEYSSYSVSEKELLAIIFALSHFKHQIYGSKIYVITDAECLRFLYSIPAPKNRLGRWAVYLSWRDFEII